MSGQRDRTADELLKLREKLEKTVNEYLKGTDVAAGPEKELGIADGNVMIMTPVFLSSFDTLPRLSRCLHFCISFNYLRQPPVPSCSIIPGPSSAARNLSHRK